MKILAVKVYWCRTLNDCLYTLHLNLFHVEYLRFTLWIYHWLYTTGCLIISYTELSFLNRSWYFHIDISSSRGDTSVYDIGLLTFWISCNSIFDDTLWVSWIIGNRNNLYYSVVLRLLVACLLPRTFKLFDCPIVWLLSYICTWWKLFRKRVVRMQIWIFEIPHFNSLQ